MIVASTRTTGSEGDWSGLDAPTHFSWNSSKMEPNTRLVWSMVSMRHVVVPCDVDDCMEAIAKVWYASSSGKFSIEKPTVW